MPDEEEFDLDEPNDHDMDFINIEVVDYLTTFGCYIDRDLNEMFHV